jgi:PIN domain nuclease of toxin-antitoxin system
MLDLLNKFCKATILNMWKRKRGDLKMYAPNHNIHLLCILINNVCVSVSSLFELMRSLRINKLTFLVPTMYQLERERHINSLLIDMTF